VLEGDLAVGCEMFDVDEAFRSVCKPLFEQPLSLEIGQSEINAWITSFWDEGFYVRLGDEMNGFRAEGHCITWNEVERWLDEQARIYYPDSVYARKSAEPD
jgi:hypothetical protein